ncbi:hypothetical protein [Streptomyces sp. TM32]|nr:hypothetical protein [Streptomyces sp. TM32]
MIGEGWPPLLSSLKTMLETGEPLPEPPAQDADAVRTADGKSGRAK